MEMEMGMAFGWLGGRLARFLSSPTHLHGSGPTTRQDRLLPCLKAGDVFVVEVNSHVSTAIKYRTQSTWSQATLDVDGHLAEAAGGNPASVYRD